MVLIVAIIITLIFSVLGKKMGREPIIWGILGFALVIGVCFIPFFTILLLRDHLDPGAGMFWWGVSPFVAFIIGIGIAVFIAYKYKLKRF